MNNWQPIETAPKASAEAEHIHVLVCQPCGAVYVAAWDEDRKMWLDPGLPYGHEDQWANNPTHWAPIPELPAECQ